MNDSLSKEEAYEAMFRFLEAYWERGGKTSDDIAILLGSMSLLRRGRPLDMALWSDWLEAIDKGVGEGAEG
ncbi:hypothetical protein [Terricaulis silvestris]|uniref:Uncharacterized protein n=1 Tax=Terricaulis silvestris TaxID=2686094 RepID=A0A6I6MGY2_9CAUL|nr:hypothetical protein [Terricaulis silvestris]QGZ94000.1 hypothetical protein DSM104635_00816 [Terricaulis silvestris]